MRAPAATTPLDVLDVLRTSLEHIRARPALFIGMAAACALPGFAFATWGMPYVHTLAHTYRPWRSVDDLLMRSHLSTGISAVVLIVIAVLTSAFRTTVATLAVIAPHLGAKDVIDEARARFFAVVRTHAAALALIGLGLVFVVAPGVYAAIELTFAQSVTAHERKGVAASMMRGVEVIEGQRGAMFMLYAGVFTPHVLMSIVRMGVGDAGDMAVPLTTTAVLMLVLGEALYVATTLVSAVATAVAYTRLSGPITRSISESVDVFA